MNTSQKITVETVVNAPAAKIWEYWTMPEHITNWYFASEDWEAPHAENDLKVGGKFLTKMAAKDGSVGFDFTGEYTNIIKNEVIEYDMDDGRHVETKFEEVPEGVKVTQIFDPEETNPPEMQRQGWQAILENFKKYVEGIS